MTVLAEAHLYKQTTYLYGLGDSPLAGDDGASWTYLSGRDALNSVRQETDAAGQVLSARSFAPYGVPLSGDGGAPFGFTGEFHDAASGLVFLRARYLQVADGRFITRDTWPGEDRWPITFNGWAYSYGNPLRFTDKSGHRPCEPDASCNADYTSAALYDLTRSLENKYQITVSGKWELDELRELKWAMDAIAEKTGADGQWIRHVLNGTRFERWRDDQSVSFSEGTTRLELPMHPLLAYRKYIENGDLPACAVPQIGNLVPGDTVYAFDAVYPVSLVHETGHIISYRYGRSTGTAASDAMTSQVNMADPPTKYAAAGGALEDMPESWTLWVLGTSTVRQAVGDRTAHLPADRANFIQALIVALGGVP